MNEITKTCKGPMDAPQNEWARDIAATDETYRRAGYSVRRDRARAWSAWYGDARAWGAWYGVSWIPRYYVTADEAMAYVDSLIGAPDVDVAIPCVKAEQSFSPSLDEPVARAKGASEGASFGLRNLISWIAKGGRVPVGTQVRYVRINGEERLTLVLPKGVK